MRSKRQGGARRRRRRRRQEGGSGKRSTLAASQGHRRVTPLLQQLKVPAGEEAAAEEEEMEEGCLAGEVRRVGGAEGRRGPPAAGDVLVSSWGRSDFPRKRIPCQRIMVYCLYYFIIKFLNYYRIIVLFFLIILSLNY